MKECELILRKSCRGSPRGSSSANCRGRACPCPTAGSHEGCPYKILPMQPPGNHQMHHQPEIFFKAETDAFPETSQLNNLLTFNRRNRRCCSSQKERRVQLDTFKWVIEKPPFQRFDVDSDVRQLRHAGKINAGVGGRERLEGIEFERSSQQRRRR